MITKVQLDPVTSVGTVYFSLLVFVHHWNTASKLNAHVIIFWQGSCPLIEVPVSRAILNERSALLTEAINALLRFTAITLVFSLSLLGFLGVWKEGGRKALAEVIHTYFLMSLMINIQSRSASVHAKEKSRKVKVTGNVEGERRWKPGCRANYSHLACTLTLNWKAAEIQAVGVHGGLCKYMCRQF